MSTNHNSVDTADNVHPKNEYTPTKNSNFFSRALVFIKGSSNSYGLFPGKTVLLSYTFFFFHTLVSYWLAPEVSNSLDSNSDITYVDSNSKMESALSTSITVDATSLGTGIGQNITVSHTTGTLTNGILVVGISRSGTTATVSSITYNSLPLTRLGGIANGSNSLADIWYLVNPPTGTFDVVTDIPDAAANQIVGVTTYEGVDQTNPFNGATGTSLGISNQSIRTITANEGELAIDVFSINGSNAVAGTNQTELWGAVGGNGSSQPGDISGTVTMEWTAGAAGSWSHFRAALSPAPPVDSDGDNINDIVDLDDDNDGIPDLEEGAFTNSDRLLRFESDQIYSGTPPGPGTSPILRTAVDGVTNYFDGSNNATALNFTGWSRPGNTSVDWTEGQYVLQSNWQAHLNHPAMILPSPAGGGFAIFSTSGEALSKDLDVIPGVEYSINLWFGSLPNYHENDKDTDGTPGIDPDAGDLSQYGGNIEIGVISGGAVAPGYTSLGTQIDPAGNPSTTDPYYSYDILTDFAVTYTAADFPASLPAYEPSGVYGSYPTLDPHWTQIQVRFVATSTVATIQLKTDNGAWSVFTLDDLEIGYDLEAYDTDNDGVANYLDLDSDNDGIYDLDEAGHAATDGDNDGVIDGLPSAFGTNGLFDGLESSADSDDLNYVIADSEATPDGTYDAYELDADGDTCFDTEEEGINDSDNDGIAGTGTPTVDPTTGLVSTITYGAPVNNNWQNSSIALCLIEICNNGIDDDGDGLIDCADCADCATSASCNDNDNDGIGDICDLDDDNDGIPDADECNGTFALDGTHTVNTYTTTQFSSTASGIQYDINLINGITFNTSVGPNLSNFTGGPPSPYDGAQSHLWLEINTDRTVDNHGTFTITFPHVVVNPTIYFSDFSSNSGSPDWSLSLINQTTDATMNLIYTDGDFEIEGDTIRAAESTSTNGSGLIEFTGYVTQLQFQIGHYTESNLDGPVNFAANIGYTLCDDIDSDGVPSMYDLDSDNDGIYDIDEAGHSAVDADDDGVIDGVNSLFGSNGLFDALETTADNAILNYTIADSEASPDGTYDAYESDADGDNCFDTEEEGVSDTDTDGVAGTGTPVVDPSTGLVTAITYGNPSNNIWQNPTIGPCLAEICNDGIDNDNDSDTDCADADCAPLATATSNGPICEGGNLLLSETGGEGVSWSWSGPSGATANSQSFGLGNVDTDNAGTYSVTVTNGSGCTAISTVDVVINSAPTATAGSNSPICEGEDLNLTESGGDAVSWSWSGPNAFTSTDQNPTIVGATSLATGAYTVTITDAASCTTTATVSVTVGTSPTITVGSNSPICEGEDLNLTESGGDAVSWSWSGPNAFTSTNQNPTITGATSLATGTYLVTITDAASCTATSSVTVTVNTAPTATAGGNTPVCEGEDLNLTETGGDGVSWLWSGPNSFSSTDQNPTITTATALAAGTYTVTVTDASSCTSTSSVTIVTTTAPTATAGGNTPICEGEDLNLTENGGSAVSWSWSGPNTFTSTDQNPTITAATTAASGTYSVTITDAGSCTAVSTVDITISPEPTILTQTTGNPSSCGGSDGTIDVTAGSGTGSFEYRLDSGTWGSSGSFSGLTAGSYVVGIRNDNGTCEITTSSITLSDPSSPTASITMPADDCQGETASFTATDAGPGATYAWDFGTDATPATATGIGPHSVVYSSDGAKSIDLTVSLAGCSAGDLQTYTVYPLPAATLTPDGTTVCEGSANMIFTATPGFANYNWSLISGDATIVGAPSANSLEVQLGTANFTLQVDVTDANSCVSSIQSSITLSPAPTATSGSNSPVCQGSNIDLTETGGDGVSWSWSGPNGFTSSAKDTTITDASALMAGDYTVIATDANGCTSSSTTTVVINSTSTVTIGSNSPLCVGQAINLTESGGDAISWSWTGPDGFTSTIQNPIITSPTIANGGDYIVIITDGSSCTATDTVNVVMNTLPTALAGNNGSICAGDSLKLTESAGDAISWSWSGPNGFTSTEQNPNIENPTGVSSGTYTVTVTGNNSCTITSTTDAIVYDYPNVTLVTPVDPTACGASDGSITVNANQGTGSFEFRLNSDPWQSTGSFTGLPAGAYTIEVRNDNGSCLTTHGTIITLSDPASPTADIILPASVCQDDSANFTATDAGPGATYTWDFGADASPATATGIGPHAVTYSSPGSKAIDLQVLSSTGCGASDGEVYTVFSLPVVTLTLSDDEACVNEASFTLGGGIPSGGTYSGTGVSAGDFDPAAAGVGTHTITYTYTDGNGCTNSTTDDLIVHDLPTVTFTLTDEEACLDEASFTLGGGFPGSGLYSGPGVEADGLTFNPATAGVGVHLLTYTITDPNGCVNTALDAIEVYDLPTVTLTLTDDEACEDDGILTLGGGSPSGAGGVFSGSFVTGPTTFDVAAAGVGTHTVTYTYTDANGCSNSANADIEVYPSPTPSLVLGIDEACVSETNVALTGGNPLGGVYSGTGVTGSVFDPSVAGVGIHTITYTYTDGNGCNNTATDDIEVITLPTVGLTLGDDIACEDEATITLSGGTPTGGTYSGAFVTGPTTFDVAAAGPGTHTITYTYTAGDGCVNTATDDIIVYSFPSVVSADPTHLATCGVNDGTITITGTGGSGSYEYRINGGAWQSGNVFSGLSASDYTVEIRNDNGTCIALFAGNPVTVNEPPGATITNSAVITSNYNGEDISCNGDSDGSARATAANGSPPYTYVWSNGQTGQDLVNVPAGTYFVTATDNTSCEAVTSIEVTEPDVISAGATVINVSCFGGSDGEIDLNVTGGVNAFTYAWDDLSTEAFYNFDFNTDDQTGNGHDRTGGTGSLDYDTDAVFGSASFAFDGNTKIKYDDGTDFLESNISELTIQVWIKPKDLVGDHLIYEEGGPAFGGVALGLSGDQLTGAVALGNSPKYAVPMTIPNDGQWHHVGLVFGDEDLTLFVDGVMGTTINTTYSNLTLGAINPWNQGGIGGGFNTNAFGSSGNFFYEGLMDNFSYHREALNINQIEDSFDDDGDREGLPAGDYDVLISDLNGCNTTITVTITQPDELLLDTIPTEVSCFGGSDGQLDLIVTGGTTPYTYNWSNGSTSQDISGLTPGLYQVTVTDDNGCTASIQSYIIEPTVLTADADVTSDYGSGQNVSCAGASDAVITATGGGGRPNYSYLWNTGAITDDINGVGAGTYTVTITDDNGCTETASVTVVDPITVSVTANIESSFGTGDVSCVGASDGEASATPANGQAPFSYVWSDGQSGPNAINLSATTYTVTITDDNGCTATSSVTLTNPDGINPNLVITSDYNGEDISCPGEADGSIFTNPSGGGGGYRYEWSHDNSLSDLTDTITDLVAGTYRVTVTDIYGCTGTAAVILNNPPPVTAVITINSDYNGFDISCNGGADGDITAIPGGGVGPYSYTWRKDGNLIPNTTANINNAEAGTYRVRITDANGCRERVDITLTEPAPITFSTAVAPTDCGVDNGIILVFASGGSGGYEYNIDNGPWQTTSSFTGLLPGTYEIRVRNGLGTCVEGPQSAVIEVTEAPIISSTTVIHPTTSSSTDGGILVATTGVDLAKEYRLVGETGWQSSPLFENLTIGTYSLETRYVGQNCISSQNFTLVAGGGVESSGSTLSFCSGDVTATQFVETYFIPGPETQLLNAFQSIYDETFCGGLTRAPVDPITSYISIGVVESGTIVHYDHWEDGYEPNLTFPIQGTTEIWGDNNPANGIPPGFAIDFLSAADIIVLDNQVPTSPRGTSILYDGQDNIGSRGNLAVTRLAWAEGSETLLAGALEVYPQESWGVNYTFPVGVDRDVNTMFSYTGAIVMAREDGTVVNYINNGTPATTTLNKGQSLHIDDNIRVGDDITASAPVQVHLLTGAECSRFSSRFFTLKPTEQWASDYYNPVATLNDGSEVSSGVNRPTYVHLYNPNSSAITVSWETSSGTQPNITVNANSTSVQQIPDGTGTHFFTADGRIFYAIATIDSDPGFNTANDWGYALLPSTQLSPQITMVGFAPGANPADLEKCCDSGTWTLFDFDSENTASGNFAINSIDDDINTFWHTQFSPTSDPYPHHIEIDLGFANTFTGFRYTPRQDGGVNGTIAGYELSYWNGAGYTPITSGTWASNTSVKTVSFSPVTARYVRLIATSEINGGPWTSAAEFAVLRPENSAPIWITADYPTGSSSTGNITICIDHDGDGGAIFDGNGIGYDESISVAELGQYKIYDPDDSDQTGTRIWVCDGSDAIIAGAYGQDPSTASGASPAIDLGTGLPNGIPFSISKCADLTRDVNGNGLFDECDEVTYTVMVRNTGALPLSTGSITVIDTLVPELTYIPNSTVAIIGNSFTNLPDNASPASVFPMDETGYQHNSIIAPNDSILFQFTAVINNLTSALFVDNTAYAVSSGGAVLAAEVNFPVETPISPAGGIVPNDTTVTCEEIPFPEFQDTCLASGYLSQFILSTHGTDSDASFSNTGDQAIDGSSVTYWLSGSNPSTGCATGYAPAVAGSINVNNPNAAIGAPDGSFAQLYEQSDQLTIDLGEVMSAGKDYTFTWRKRPSSGTGTLSVFIYESSDGINYYLRPDSPYSTTNTSFSTVTFTAFNNTRYVRLINQNGNDLEVDALAFQTGCTPGAAFPLPHNIDLDLGGSYDVSGFQYTPRQDASDGRIANYEFYVSTDGTNWGAPVSTGTWTSGTDAESVIFPSTTGRYVRLVALSEVNGGNLAAVAELNIAACVTATTFAETNNQTANGSCTDIEYDIVRTWTTTDYCGNVFVETQTITLIDTTAPVLTNIPANITTTVSAIPEPPILDCSSVPNVAQGRPTQQISTDYGGVSSRAVDGNTNGNYSGALSTTHTTNMFTPWWEVDLQSVYEIDYVNIYNRTDCCADRLSNFYVLVSKEPFTSDVLATNLANPEIMNFFYGPNVGTPTAITLSAYGRYIRIQRQDSEFLSITEFEVYPVCLVSTDNCDPNPSITFAETSTPMGCSYDIVRTWTTTDACGNSSTESQTLSVSSALETNTAVTSDYNGRDISCFNGSDGEAEVTTMGGAAPITYLWTGGQTGSTATGLSAGKYYVTATDNLGCQTIDSITLSEPSILDVAPPAINREITCFGGSNGRVIASASGGTGAKSYLWSTGETTALITGLSSGTYTVTASDINGCTATGSVTLSDPPELVVNPVVDNPTTCIGDSDGAASVTASGGTGSLSYVWSNGATATSITGLSANTYRVTVTDDNGCAVIDSVVISDPAELIVNVTTSTAPSLCEGSDGTITVSATGGSGSYEYRLGTSFTWTSSNTFSGLSSGNYEIYVRNADGTCPTGPFRDTLVDPIPSSCPISPESDPLTVCASDISIPFSVPTVTGATAYNWAEPFGMLIMSGQGTESVIISANDVAPGTYDICVFTESNCGTSPPCCFTFDVVPCAEICNNGTDDDFDGLIDCDDPDCGTLAEINADPACVNEVVAISADDGGSGATYVWNFGVDASPTTATGIGPHNVTYSTCGTKTISLEVTRGACVETNTETVEITDTEAPTADPLPALGPFACYSDVPVADINDVQNETDNCSAVTVSIVGDTPSNPGCGGTVTRTYRLTDVCGNTTDLEQFININDNIGPTFTLPADTTLYLDVSCAIDSSITSIGTVTDTLDNCNAPMTVTYLDNTFGLTGCNNTGTFTRAWTVTDACGNRTTMTQTITVIDTVSATADPLPDLGPFTCYSDIPPADITDVQNEVDNCGGTVTVTHVGDTPPTAGCSDTVIRTYRLTDECSNITDITQNIFVDQSSIATGGLTIDSTIICLSATLTGVISAVPDGNAVVPCEYKLLYVLTEGVNDVVLDTSSTANFNLTATGDYEIHTLIYDSVATSPNYLDLSTINFGVTQLAGIESVLEQGGGALCGVLDMTGAAAAAIVCEVNIGDFVWEDTNEDGIQDAGEPGIEGVTVSLYDDSDVLIATTTTSPTGYYQFDDITSGTYYIAFDVSTNVNGITAYKGTLQNVGPPETDSDPNIATGRTPLFLLDSSLGDVTTLDAGYILSCPPSSQVGGVNVIRK